MSCVLESRWVRSARAGDIGVLNEWTVVYIGPYVRKQPGSPTHVFFSEVTNAIALS